MSEISVVDNVDVEENWFCKNLHKYCTVSSHVMYIITALFDPDNE